MAYDSIDEGKLRTMPVLAGKEHRPVQPVRRHANRSLAEGLRGIKMDAELEDALKDSLDRHKVSKRDRARITKWVEAASVSAALLENLKTGQMDISGFRDGEGPLFSITEQGSRYVEEKLLPRAGDGEGK